MLGNGALHQLASHSSAVCKALSSWAPRQLLSSRPHAHYSNQWRGLVSRVVHPSSGVHRASSLIASGNAASSSASAAAYSSNSSSSRTRRSTHKSQPAIADVAVLTQQQQQQQREGAVGVAAASRAAAGRKHLTTAAAEGAAAADSPAGLAAAAAGTGTPTTARRSRKSTAAAGQPAAAHTASGDAANAQAAAGPSSHRSTTTSSSRGAGGRSHTHATPDTSSGSSGSAPSSSIMQGPHSSKSQPLPHVLILHTGGTLGMDAVQSFEIDPHADPHHPPVLKRGTGGIYGGLEPGQMLSNIFQQVPELSTFANLDLQVVFNKDSSRVGPKEWVQIAKILDKNRQAYDAFLLVHGTDTMSYTAAALSFMLAGFKKPIVMTGSQLPLSSPRSDARQNLIDALTCATASYTAPHVVPLHEVAVCFGGKLMRGNRARKVNSTIYQAFDSPSYPYLAKLGVDVEWNERFLLRAEGGYVPRFKLEPAVLRVPIVPGCDPRTAYGDLVERGVRGIVLEAFGVGNFPDLPQQGWVPWLRQQTRSGLQVYLSSQCRLGTLKPELYKSGALAIEMGVEAGPQMTPEAAVVKMMLCLAHPDIPLVQPLAGEL